MLLQNFSQAPRRGSRPGLYARPETPALAARGGPAQQVQGVPPLALPGPLPYGPVPAVDQLYALQRGQDGSHFPVEEWVSCMIEIARV